MLNKIKEKNEIIKNDFYNLINTYYYYYYQFYNNIDKTSVPLIIEKIINIIQFKDKNFLIKDITINNYNENLEELKNLRRLF